MIKLVVFDMAGTTVNEQNIVYKTLRKAIEKEGFDVTLEEVLQYGAGKEKRQAILDILEHIEGGKVHNTITDSIFHAFETTLDEAYRTFRPAPMPEAENVLEQLRKWGIKVVLNTGYKRAVAEYLIQELGWEEGVTFDLLVTASDVARGRPEPDMIQLAMDHFGILNAKNVAKIGDSTVDIEEGRNAGCRIYAGITTGAQTAELLQSADPTHIFHGLEDLLPVLQQQALEIMDDQD